MKRFWLVLLSLGLIVAFSTSAMAVDVKFSGDYYAAGMYLDKTNVKKDPAAEGVSTAFYFQRMRLNTTFVVHPGLYLQTRANIMERVWGATRSTVSGAEDLAQGSAATRAENENIGFDLVYVTYVSPVGIFLAGYQIDGAWGTVFGDNSQALGKIGYQLPIGPVTLGIQTGKNPTYEKSRTAINAATAADADGTLYTAYAKYAFKGGEVGILGKYVRNAYPRTIIAPPSYPYQVQLYNVLPYVKAKVGPVAIQAEIWYMFGKEAKYESPSTKSDVDTSQIAGWVDATADFGKFYVGGTIAYASGDDPSSTDKTEGGRVNGGIDWQPCLIMWNNERTYFAGDIAGFDGTAQSAAMTNAWFFQGRVGVRPIDKLDIGMSVSYANQDKKFAVNSVAHDYGYEVDLTATYKITNNLSYMLGGGYLFTGKYYKGFSDANNIQNDFLIINKLSLTF